MNFAEEKRLCHIAKKTWNAVLWKLYIRMAEENRWMQTDEIMDGKFSGGIDAGVPLEQQVSKYAEQVLDTELIDKLVRGERQSWVGALQTGSCLTDDMPGNQRKDPGPPATPKHAGHLAPLTGTWCTFSHLPRA